MPQDGLIGATCQGSAWKRYVEGWVRGILNFIGQLQPVGVRTSCSINLYAEQVDQANIIAGWLMLWLFNAESMEGMRLTGAWILFAPSTGTAMGCQNLNPAQFSVALVMTLTQHDTLIIYVCARRSVG